MYPHTGTQQRTEYSNAYETLLTLVEGEALYSDISAGKELSESLGKKIRDYMADIGYEYPKLVDAIESRQDMLSEILDAYADSVIELKRDSRQYRRTKRRQTVGVMIASLGIGLGLLEAYLQVRGTSLIGGIFGAVRSFNTEAVVAQLGGLVYCLAPAPLIGYSAISVKRIMGEHDVYMNGGINTSIEIAQKYDRTKAKLRKAIESSYLGLVQTYYGRSQEP